MAQEVADRLAIDLQTAAMEDDDQEGDPHGWRAQECRRAAEAATMAQETTASAIASALASAAAADGHDNDDSAQMLPSTRFRLLGELPQLTATRHNAPPPPRRTGSSAPKPRRLPKRRPKPPPPAPADSEHGERDGRGDDGPTLEPNAPSDFLCAINQHIMRKPLRSPHGYASFLAPLDCHALRRCQPRALPSPPPRAHTACSSLSTTPCPHRVLFPLHHPVPTSRALPSPPPRAHIACIRISGSADTCTRRRPYTRGWTSTGPCVR